MGSNLVAKIEKYFNKVIFSYTWSITKGGLNLLVDDFEQQHKFEKI
jgi:hypothetical protein